MATSWHAAASRLTLIVCAAISLGVTHPGRSAEARMLVQSSPLAGFQYHAAQEFWGQLKVGDRLTLVREPDNPHDSNAVRVEWQDRKLGYVPRRENRAVAQHMDRGGRVEARISKLTVHRDPWKRIEFEVLVEL